MLEQKQIAETIMGQFSQNTKWYIGFDGNAVYLNRNMTRRGGVQFRVRIRERQHHILQVELTCDDLYRVSLHLKTPKGLQLVYQIDMVYCDQLDDLIYKICFYDEIYEGFSCAMNKAGDMTLIGNRHFAISDQLYNMLVISAKTFGKKCEMRINANGDYEVTIQAPKRQKGVKIK